MLQLREKNKSPHLAAETNECAYHTVAHLKPVIFNNNMLENAHYSLKITYSYSLQL